MNKKTLSSFLIAVLLILAIAIMFPAGKNSPETPRLPWDIAIDTAGNTSVFNLTLSQSTLADAQKEFKKEAKISMFVSPEERYTIEAYFKQLYISGIRADLILTLEVDPTSAAQMYDRGQRLSQLGSGEKKITLAHADNGRMLAAPISHITYLPAASLDAELIEDRFGKPEIRHTEPSGIAHWLYPKKGLDIALDPKGRAVLQYTSPAQFERITQPLYLNIDSIE